MNALRLDGWNGGFGHALGEAVRYWEVRRLPYNLALAAVFVGWLLLGPPLGAASTANALMALVVLVLAANACYCAAYVADIALQESALREWWHRRRLILWSAGTLFALALEFYWIADELIVGH